MSHFVISDDLKNLFLQRLEESVTQGDTIQYVKSRKSTTTIRNGEGEIIRTQETISEERNTTLMKTTPQAIPILDRALSVEAAMNLLMREGYVIEGGKQVIGWRLLPNPTSQFLLKGNFERSKKSVALDIP